MFYIYNVLVILVSRLFAIMAWWSPKMKLAVHGRKTVFETLAQQLDGTTPVFWFHSASLGEYEQGVPVMEVLKQQYPEFKILVTFFSPSGYEAKKKSKLADVLVYLPLDTASNAKRFLEIVKPTMAIFIKYEFWPNYFKYLGEQKIPIVLISTRFRENQAFFKWYGGFMRNTLKTVTHFFVQDKTSLQLLDRLGYEQNVTLNGDTRFDRVSRQLEMDNTLDFVSDFVGKRLCVVCGSTWPEDEAILLSYMDQAPDGVCFIMAPHEIKSGGIKKFSNQLQKKTVLFSEKEDKTLGGYDVLIVDAIGYLTRIYNYADIAYVGGGMGTAGLHNILEPATFGVPIVIGKNFERFPEAKQLQELGGLFSVGTADELTAVFEKLVANKKFLNKARMEAGHFISNNTGATPRIINYISKTIPTSIVPSSH